MVDNGAYHVGGCFPADATGWAGYGTLQQAKAKCSAVAACTTLHDWGHDGNAWRACAGTMTAGGDAQAATYTIVRASAPGPTFEKAANVDNSEWRQAHARCFPADSAGWAGHGTFNEAKQKCVAEPTCTGIHDWGDDGGAWRACAGRMATGDGKAGYYRIVRPVPCA